MNHNKFDKWDWIVLGVILLVGAFVWGQPISNLPFGDVDASTHFTLSDYMSQQDKVFYELPFYINFTYGFANDGKMWYPPQFHVDGAIAQVITHSRVIGLYLFYLFCGLALIPTTYLLIRYLFGRLPAVLSVLLLLVSKRDYTTYLWGLWPEKLSFAFVPLVLYFFYRYTEERKQGYLVWTSVLLACQFFLHPQGAVHSVAIIGIFVILFWIFKKELVVRLGHLFIPGFLFILLVTPFAFGVMGFGKNVMGASYGDSFKIQQLDTLLKWYPEVPYTPQFGDFGYVYSWFLLPFLLLGIFWCICKRDKAHWLMLAFVAAMYFLMHLNVLGITGRIHRSLNAEAHIFIPLAILGLLWVVSFITNKISARAVFLSLFCTYFVFMAIPTWTNLTQAYQDVGRPNQLQYDACEWIRTSLPEDAHILNFGTLNYNNRKWIQALCLRHFIFDDVGFTGEKTPEYGMQQYVFFDKTEAFMINQPLYTSLVNMSKKFVSKPLYSNTMVEVYTLATN